ncbi:OmpA family protein [Caulobacter sp. NIBR1757]|uniref:OmpA family protein n=1 Tax=Caulobacter sp. NIBR1757 TaxID=3016000 RepID=UPI0022EFF22A|nr:OmpA family protein [Caulobacter sp. NIBR1757]WGM37438.1 Peptidoglycan-associated lipoprotein [Caulobacter sp. NIBR1757]
MHRNLLILGIAVLALTACKTTPKTEVARFTRCEEVNVAIYFEPASAVIGRESRAVLRGAAARARGCDIDRVDVTGLADSVGTPEANMKLSEQRAAAVTKTLMGFGMKDVRVMAVGDSGALTPAGAAMPLRRRAEVILRLSPPGT